MKKPFSLSLFVPLLVLAACSQSVLVRGEAVRTRVEIVLGADSGLKTTLELAKHSSSALEFVWTVASSSSCTTYALLDSDYFDAHLEDGTLRAQYGLPILAASSLFPQFQRLGPGEAESRTLTLDLPTGLRQAQEVEFTFFSMLCLTPEQDSLLQSLEVQGHEWQVHPELAGENALMTIMDSVRPIRVWLYLP